MTRKEEIDKEANRFANTIYEGEIEKSHAWCAFSVGAEWADRTMIVKTCRWLLEHGMTQHVIERYRKDMEE